MPKDRAAVTPSEATSTRAVAHTDALSQPDSFASTVANSQRDQQNIYFEQERAAFGHKKPEGRFKPSVLLTVKQVATQLAVCARTVRRLIRRGALVAHRIGRSIRVDASSVTLLIG